MANSNIHVAFQNMSISTHPTGGIPVGHQVHHVAPSIPSHNAHLVNSSISTAGPGQAVQYTRMTEMYVPYYPHQKPGSTGCMNGTHVTQVNFCLASYSFKPVKMLYATVVNLDTGLL